LYDSLHEKLSDNFPVQGALSGAHALVVLDYMLPGLNGFEVLRQARAARCCRL
jgi:DNA-binding response OmpR family regulator